MSVQIASPSGQEYTVGDKVYDTDRFRVYLCTAPDQKWLLLKIAANEEGSDALDREALMLQRLKEEADSLEREFEPKRKDERDRLNYSYYFPCLVESFRCEDQDDARINILDVSLVYESPEEFVPIDRIRTVQGLFVDPMTSAWMLGKALKLLTFIQNAGVSLLGCLDGENVIINPEKHYVSVFDWSQAKLRPGPVSKRDMSIEISEVAKTVIRALGGNVETGALLEDEQLANYEYEDMVWGLASMNEKDAFSAHSKFYELIRRIWPRAFHPFGTRVPG